MTREEAIKIIDCYDIGFYDLSGEKIPADKLADAFDMAIEALQTPPITQRSMYQAGYRQGREDALKREPSEDLISRAEAIEAIELVDWYHQNSNKDMVHGANDDEHQAWYKATDVYRALEAVPTADRPRSIEPTITVDLKSGIIPRSACEPKGMKTIIYADRPRGEWIEQEDDYHHYWECSECGMGVGLDDIRNFCPNCGSDNRERRE